MASLNAKISPQGEWLRFLGYSSIMKIKDYSKFDYLFSKLNELEIFNFLKLLPTDSLHMTLFNIWCYSQTPLRCINNYIVNYKEFEFFVNNKILLPTNYLRKEHDDMKIFFRQYKDLKVKANMVKIKLNDNILRCDLFFEDKYIEIFNKIINKMEQVYGKKSDIKLHCTLGYVYKPYNKSDNLVYYLKELQNYFNNNLDMFEFYLPSVYFFLNMGDFTDYLKQI